MEEWKDIKGYEGLYIISNKGRIAKVLHPKINKDGYCEQGLVKNKVKKGKRIHRLVAETFIPNPDNLSEVNHIDENKLNNEVNNLEWCTHKYNTNHGTRIERISETQRNRKDCSKPVMCIETGIVYPSINEASRQTGADRNTIADVCKGKLKTARGYHWKYKDGEA